MWRTAFGALTAALLATLAIAQPQPAIQVSGQTSLWRVSKVIGVPIYNGQEEKIGQIEDLVLDHQGRVKAALLSAGRYLGTGDRLVAVSLEVLRFPNPPVSGTSPTDPVNAKWYPDRAVLNITKDALMALPAFEF
jgi:sporulation protein YlmC with PRC-barrel domain